MESQARQMTLTVSDYRRLSQSALIEYGTAPELAETVTEALLWCDAHGITSHGLNMLPTYLERLHAGGINGQVSPKVIKQRGAVAVIDSQGGFGQVAGEFATRLALQQAKEHAVGLASVQNTNHGGALGYYTEMISQQGCVGFMAHNANATMAPFGGAETALGTNPLSFGFPGKTYPVVIDMATSATAKGKLYELARKSDTIPEGLALDANGEPTTSVQAAIKGILLPLGGPKGYSLAVAVEMLTGVLSGGLISKEIKSLHKAADQAQGSSMLVIAIDIDAFMEPEEYQERFARFESYLKGTRPMKGFERVMLPGEREYAMAQQRHANGVPVLQSIIDDIQSHLKTKLL